MTMWSFEDWWGGYLAWVAAQPGAATMSKPWAQLEVAPGTARRDGAFRLAHNRFWQERHEHTAPVVVLEEESAKLDYVQAFGRVFDVEGYQKLAEVISDVYYQAAKGKGKERHANDLPFHLQPMQQIATRRGIGFILGQADKKSEEAQGMLDRGESDKATHELLGAMVYLAGAVIHIREKEERKREHNQ